jgi:transcriptional regulator with XRE-family HTH domain
MGRAKQEQPQRIAQKLRQIRQSLGITQEQMAELLEKEGVKVYRGYIGSFEIGERVPSLLITLAYAQVVKIPMETLVDDKLELPKHLN